MNIVFHLAAFVWGMAKKRVRKKAQASATGMPQCAFADLMRHLERSIGHRLRKLEADSACFSIERNGATYELRLCPAGTDGTVLLVTMSSNLTLPLDGIPEFIRRFVAALNEQMAFGKFDLIDDRGRSRYYLFGKTDGKSLSPQLFGLIAERYSEAVEAVDQTITTKDSVR
jgi:hypothetical protein